MTSSKTKEPLEILEEVLVLDKDEAPMDDFLKRIAADPSQIHVSYFTLADGESEDSLLKKAA